MFTKDKRALIVAQRTCDEEVLNYVSSLETVRMKDEKVLDYVSNPETVRMKDEGFKRSLTRYSGIFE